MKVIVSDPISEHGLRILTDNNIEVIDAYGANIDETKQYSYSDISLYYYQNVLNQ